MRNKITIATTLLGALVASPAVADDKMELGVFGGIHFWNDDNELGLPGDAGGYDELADSPIFGVRIGRRLHAAISAEGELGLAPSSTRTAGTDVVAIGYRLHALVHPARFVDDRLEPFALLGIGGFTSASSDQDVLTNDSDFVVHAGVGLKYRIGRDWGVRFDARLLLPPANEGLVTADGELLIGIYKAFPRKPTTPPVTKPTPTDQDGDGIDDTADRCPAEAEDLDGHGDDDGCVDPDNDGDGVADTADRCAAQAETANGFDDSDGCPDEAPPAIAQFNGVMKGIDFATNSDQLTPTSSRVLDEAKRVLDEYPTLRLEISGHTDSTGNPDYNRDLSKRRAEAVKTYLVAGGIAAERLEAVGYGPDRPIADNATPDGRAKNRRVEFRTR